MVLPRRLTVFIYSILAARDCQLFLGDVSYFLLYKKWVAGAIEKCGYISILKLNGRIYP